MGQSIFKPLQAHENGKENYPVKVKIFEYSSQKHKKSANVAKFYHKENSIKRKLKY
jgi:hypothetical protein